MSVAMTPQKFKTVEERFDDSVKEITKRLEHLHELAKAEEVTSFASRHKRDIADRWGRIDQVDPSAARQEARLPQILLPFPRNSRFHGRRDVLDRIDTVLKLQDSNSDVSSVALYGTGGIGKTQIALEFAYRRVSEGCQLVIWIPSETEPEIHKALADAAGKIHPPGFRRESDRIDMRQSLLDWLQWVKLDPPWLIIFDNVEDNEMLSSRHYWPLLGKGEIIVTCRSEMVAQCPAKESIEIPSFGNGEGAQALMKIAGRTDITNEDLTAATEISELLGGLPLGIDITARHLYSQKVTTARFLEQFKKRQSAMTKPPRFGTKNPYYNRTLESVWDAAFKELDDNSRLLLGVLCMIAPDGVPRGLLVPNNALEGHWAFLSDQWEYDQAQLQLLHLSLIRTDTGSNTLATHRLTQAAFRERMSNEQKCDALDTAYRLLSQAFPARKHGRHLFGSWRDCEKLVHHAAAVSENYEVIHTLGLNIQTHQWAVLMADVAWFCSETERLQLGAHLGSRALEKWEDKNCLDYAYLCEGVATVEHRQGRYRLAHKKFRTALQIRVDHPKTSQKVLADSWSAVGLALYGMYRSKDSIAAVNRAYEIADQASPEERKTYNVDRYLRNLSRPKVYLGRYSDAIRDLDEAEKFQDEIYGPGSRFHGETTYIRADIARRQGNLDLAARLYEEAQTTIAKDQPLEQLVTAARYHRGCICMTQGNYDQALVYLLEALRDCQLNVNKRGDAGETARIKRVIAQIWTKKGLHEEATAYRTDAETAKEKLEQTQDYPEAPDEEEAWNCFNDLVAR